MMNCLELKKKKKMKSNLGIDTSISNVVLIRFFIASLSVLQSQATFTILLAFVLRPVRTHLDFPVVFYWILSWLQFVVQRQFQVTWGLQMPCCQKNRNCFVNSGKAKFFFTFPVKRTGPAYI